MNRPFLAVAHRGLSVEEPENTLAAFRAAAAADAHGIELDVRVTHDGHVVVMHDENLARTTDAPGRVGDLDLDELRTHVTSDGAPVPTLDEVFDSLSDWDGTWNIEIKDKKATHGTLELLRNHGLEDRSMVTSMDPDALQVIHEESPDISRGLIVLGPPDDDDFEAAEETGCTWLLFNQEHINPTLVEETRKTDCKLGAWTVNDVGRAVELATMGVDMVMTDERGVLEALLAHE